MADNKENLDNNIRVERAKLRMTQEELGEKVGISRQAVHNIENKQANPSIIVSMKMAKVFGIKVEDLFKLVVCVGILIGVGSMIF